MNLIERLKAVVDEGKAVHYPLSNLYIKLNDGNEIAHFNKKSNNYDSLVTCSHVFFDYYDTSFELYEPEKTEEEKQKEFVKRATDIWCYAETSEFMKFLYNTFEVKK